MGREENVAVFEDTVTHVVLRDFSGLSQTSAVCLDQIKTIDKSRLLNYCGNIGNEWMRKIEGILRYIQKYNWQKHLDSKKAVQEISDGVQETPVVKEGILYCDGKPVGESQNKNGFSQYYFDEEPLGSGANGVTFSVTHKILGVRQVVKIYFPKEDETSVSRKAKEEAKKNANTRLASYGYSVLREMEPFCVKSIDMGGK